jgi:hypothetical protein
MQYKVLIKLYVPEVEESYEAYIPINKTIYTVNKLLADLVRTHSREITENKTLKLYNRYTGMLYDYTKIVRDTDIRNGSQLVAILEDAQQDENAA